jgi:D-alanine transaminase
MSRIAYVDRQYVPHRSAAVHIDDRGYQFAAGVYEVMAVVGGPIRLKLREIYLAHAAAAA